VTEQFQNLEKARRSPATQKDPETAERLLEQAEKRYEQAVDRLKDVEDEGADLRARRVKLTGQAYYVERGIRFPIDHATRNVLENHGFTNYDEVTGIASKENGAITIQRTEKGWRYTQKNAVALEYEIAPYGANQPGTEGFFQAHHLVQDAWAQQRLGQYGYKSNKAPTMLLRDSYRATPHELITALQDARFGTIEKRTYLEERALFIADMDAAGVPPEARTKALDAVDTYFRELRNNIKDPELRRQIFGNWEG
jgi:hypothetical protein